MRRIGPESEEDAGHDRPLTPVLIQLPSGRSGSTLLMQLLGTSEEIAFDSIYPFEHRYLVYLLHLLTPLGESFEPKRDMSDAELLLRPAGRYGPIPFDPQIVDRVALRDAAFRHIWCAFSEVVRAQQPAARFYSEKMEGDFEILIKSGLDYRLLQLVRDPRDTFASIRAFDKRRGFYGFGRLKWQSEGKYLDGWIEWFRNRIAEFARQREAGDHVMLVRYEEMVRNLAGAAERIGKWLGVSLSARAVEANRASLRHHMTSESVAASVGRWRTELPPRIRKRIEEGLRDEMRDLGY